MDTTKTVKVRVWDPDYDNGMGRSYVVEKTIEDLIRSPNSIHLSDVGFHLLNELRAERGLELMLESEFMRED